jgi:hypothetical protein
MRRQQGSDGLRGPLVAIQGGSIDIEVAPGVVFVDVGPAGSATTRYSVPKGRTVTVPVPPVPPGTVLIVSTGTGLRRRVVFIEVVAPSP